MTLVLLLDGSSFSAFAVRDTHVFGVHSVFLIPHDWIHTRSAGQDMPFPRYGSSVIMHVGLVCARLGEGKDFNFPFAIRGVI